MTLAELRKVERAYRRSALRTEQLRAQRNAAILSAIAAGLRHSQIADATDLSRGRIGQLAKTNERES
jgi:DNA-binding NarL/FixJ family response regulator